MKPGDKIAPREAFGQTLVTMGEIFPELVVFDSDVCKSTKTDLFADHFPKRFYQMGISEANMVCAAAGMSSLGYIPFVSAFSVFLSKRAGDQIRVAIAYTDANVKLNGAYGGLPTGKAGATHSSIQDIAVMRCMPNMRVLVPADGVEVELAVRLAIETEGPVYLRTARDPVPTVFERKSHRIEWGKGVLLAEGGDVGIISTGIMTEKAIKSCKILAEKGVTARVIHMPSIKPIDEALILETAKKCGVLITVENHSLLGGLGGAVSEVTSKECPCIVERIGFPDIFMESGDTEELFSQMGMSAEHIAQKVIETLRRAK